MKRCTRITRLRASVAGLMISGAAACQPDLGADILYREVEPRSLVVTEEINHLEPLFTVSPPVLDGWTFRFRDPVLIALTDPSTCEFVVADAVDEAVHWFVNGGLEVRASLYVGGRSNRLLSQVSAVAAGPDGTVFVSDRSGGVVLQIDPDWNATTTLSLRRPDATEGVTPGVRLEVDARGMIYEQLYSTGSWPPMGLVRVWDTHGNFTRHLALSARASPMIPAAVGIGDFAVRGDTLWLARRIDGRVLSFATVDGSPGRRLDLPLLFARTVAIQGANGTMVEPPATNHVDDFTLDPSGNFFVAVRNQDGTEVLAAVPWDGRSFVFYNLGYGEIRDVAATDRSLLVVVGNPAPPFGGSVLVFENPLAQGGTQAPLAGPSRCL